MGENNYLVESFGNSIGADIVEFTGEAVEFTLDTCSGEDSILKEVPFVGTAVKLCSIGSKVYDKHNFYKLKSFIKAVNTGTGKADELEKRQKKFLSNAQFRKRELEFLLILIERYVGFEKPDMLGKLYVAYIEGVINWNEMSMYAEVIDRFLPGDWGFLDKYELSRVTPESIDIDAVQRLISMGLVTETMKKANFFNASGDKISTVDIEGYVLTRFGEKLGDIIKG